MTHLKKSCSRTDKTCLLTNNDYQRFTSVRFARVSLPFLVRVCLGGYGRRTPVGASPLFTLRLPKKKLSQTSSKGKEPEFNQKQQSNGGFKKDPPRYQNANYLSINSEVNNKSTLNLV